MRERTNDGGTMQLSQPTPSDYLDGRYPAARAWLYTLSISMAVTGAALFFFDAAFSEAQQFWSIGFLACAVTAWLLARNPASEFLYVATPGLLAAAAGSRAIGNYALAHTPIGTRIVAGTIWVIFTVTIVWRWRHLVPPPPIVKALRSCDEQSLS